MNDEYVPIETVIRWYSKKKKNLKEEKCNCQHSVSFDGEHHNKSDVNMYVYQIQPSKSTAVIKPVGTVQNTHDITINKFDYYTFNCRIVSKVYTFTELVGENIFSLVRIIISYKETPKIIGILSYKFHCLEDRVEKKDINKEIRGYYLIDLTTNKNRYILYNRLCFHDNDTMLTSLVKCLKNKEVIETIDDDVEKN